MKIIKIVRNTTIVAVFSVAIALISGCGGVSEAEMAQLNNLRSEVNSLQATANSLKDQRASVLSHIYVDI